MLDGKRCKIGTRQKINLYELKLTPELPSTPLPPAAMVVSRAYCNHDLLQLWHYRLGHANLRLVGDLLGLSIPKQMPLCSPCKAGLFKSDDVPETQRFRATQRGESLHADLHNIPTSTAGNNWALIVVDEYIRYAWITFTKTKESSVIARELRNLINRLTNQFGCHVKRFRSDQGGEFLGALVDTMPKERGIEHEVSPAKTHKYNGITERVAAVIKTMSRSQLAAAGISSETYLVAESLAAATFVRNHLPTEANVGLFGQKPYQCSPYYAWYRQLPRYKGLHPFGCAVYVRVPPEERGKWSPQSRLCLFMGYV